MVKSPNESFQDTPKSLTKIPWNNLNTTYRYATTYINHSYPITTYYNHQFPHGFFRSQGSEHAPSKHPRPCAALVAFSWDNDLAQRLGGPEQEVVVTLG